MRALWVITLAACSELGPGLPDATISDPDASQAMLFLDPEVLLDFGDVSTDIETHREATVRAAEATLVIESIELAAGSSEKWRIEADDALFAGLAPGESAAIRVYFRPCPDAWSGDRIDPSYDFSLCYGRVAAGSLELSSNAGRRSLSLAGRGAEPPPALMVEPQDSLQFRWSSEALDLSWVWLNVTNLGHAPLHIDELEIVQEQDNWFLETCQSPCRLDASICSYHDPACDVPVLSLPVLFFPPSGSIGELIVRSNDPISPERTFSLLAMQHACPFPSARIDPLYTLTERNQLVALDAFQSIPGGLSQIDSYRWSWSFTSTTPPLLSGDDTRRVTFVPSQPGLYVMSLELENTCGEWNASPHLAYVEVIE